MKRILFLVTQSEFGGAQRYVFETAKYLNLRNYEVLVGAGQGDGELFRKLRNTGVQPVYLKEMRRTPWPWQMALAIKEIYNLLKKERPDILFLCSTTAGFLGSIATFFYRGSTSRVLTKGEEESLLSSPSKSLEYGEVEPRVIYRIGGWAFRDPRNFILNKFILWAEKITAPLKDKIIVNSEIDRNLAIQYKICLAEKIIKIHNGIDLNSLDFLSREEARKFLLSRSNLHCSRSDLEQLLVVGTVANFYKSKGLNYLIEAFHILRSDFHYSRSDLLKFLIIGEGKERKKLESLIKKYNLENQVFLIGKVPDAQQYLKAFDVFVLPSLKEGFPWVIIEAMAAQSAIIATKVGAIPEIIENKLDGLLIEPENSQKLAEKIAFLLKNPRVRENLGKKAREEVKQNFSLEKMLKETEKVFINTRC